MLLMGTDEAAFMKKLEQDLASRIMTTSEAEALMAKANTALSENKSLGTDAVIIDSLATLPE